MPTTLDLPALLKAHAAWLADQATGSQANLSEANLRWANLSRADLSEADLHGADLSKATLPDGRTFEQHLKTRYIKK